MKKQVITLRDINNLTSPTTLYTVYSEDCGKLITEPVIDECIFEEFSNTPYADAPITSLTSLDMCHLVAYIEIKCGEAD